jgi:hypothetical protein
MSKLPLLTAKELIKILAGKYTIIGEEKSDKTEPQNGLAKVFVKSYPAAI